MDIIQEATNDVLDIISDALHQFRDDVAGANALEENKIIENALCDIENDIFFIINEAYYTKYYMGGDND